MSRVVLTMLLVGCGAAPPVEEDTQALVAHLPPDAPLAGTLRPTVLATALTDLAARSTAVRARLDARGLPKALDPDLLSALGLDPRRAVVFTVRVGPRLALLRTADDLERLLATNAVAFDAWLEAHPPPPAWLHVRVVGHATSADAADALQARYGSLQVVGPGEPLAGALEADPGRTLPEGATLYRLLATQTPTAVVVREADDHAIVDLLVEQSLGGLAAAFAALEAPDDPVPPAHRPSGSLGPDAIARLHLSHERFGLTIRALGELVALRAALDRPPGPERAQLYARARAAARRPALLMDPGAPAFDHSVVDIGRRGEHLRLQVRSGYTPVGRALSSLRGGIAPAGHVAASSHGATVVTVSAGPGWRAVLDGVVDPLPVASGRFLAAALQCGPVCYPSVWTAIPALALAADTSGPAVFPSLAPLKAALTTSTGLDLVRGETGSAVAVRFERPATHARATWNALGGPGLTKRWADRADGVVMAVGSDVRAVESLSRADSRRSDAILEVSAALTAEESTAIDLLRATLTFDEDALRLETDLRLRPVAAE